MIEVHDVTVRSGSFCLSSLNFSVPAGSYAVLMGGTGQGKTTILEAICGLKSVERGRICLNGVDITRWKAADRGIGYVPQDLALFPTMTVQEHLEFALRLRHVPNSVREARVVKLANTLGILALLGRRVLGLSGGEAQRVALGRALSFQPSVLLLDEPLNALDDTTRDRLCALLRSIQHATGLTTLHVTHSRVEARQLADKLLMLRNGKVEDISLSELDRVPELPAESKPHVEEPSVISSGKLGEGKMGERKLGERKLGETAER